MTWCLWCSGHCMPGCEPGGKGSTPFGYPFDLHECAPGRASGLQNRLTGFDSSRSCLSPTWLDRRRHRFCKPADAGANPVVGSACPDGVVECIGPSEGPGPGSNPGRDTDSRSLRVCRSARQFSKLHTTNRIHAVGARVQLLGGLLRQYVLGVCWMGTQPCEG